MKCIISGKSSNRMTNGKYLHKDVVGFARWYAKKLNIEQVKKKSKNVTYSACMEIFEVMRGRGYDWKKIKETLTDELLLKGLIGDAEHEQLNKTEIVG